MMPIVPGAAICGSRAPLVAFRASIAQTCEALPPLQKQYLHPQHARLNLSCSPSTARKGPSDKEKCIARRNDHIAMHATSFNSKQVQP